MTLTLIQIPQKCGLAQVRKIETKAYVDRDEKTVFIDNPKNPTIFPPTLGVEDYLIKERFTKDKRSK